MPTTRGSMPETLRRSGGKARRTFTRTLSAATREYGDGGRAWRTAYAALKHSFERVGDHWEPKERRGPSDEHAASGRGDTAGGVDANASKEHLKDVARRLGVKHVGSMRKPELVEAIRRANERETRRARAGR